MQIGPKLKFTGDIAKYRRANDDLNKVQTA